MGVTPSESNNGNHVGMVSSYTTADGQSGAVADVWFAKAAPTAGELLAEAPAELLAGSTPAAAAPQAGTTLMSNASLRSLLDEEQNRQAPLV